MNKDIKCLHPNCKCVDYCEDIDTFSVAESIDHELVYCFGCKEEFTLPEGEIKCPLCGDNLEYI